MSEHSAPDTVPSTQAAAERIFRTLDRFLHIEALSGIVLIAAAAAALIWANSPFAPSYYALWHAPVIVRLRRLTSRPAALHFWINDGLMTIFFLVVGLEIRREIHGGALANMRLAALPLAAALGGVAMPALIYWSLSTDAAVSNGWAVPTATDIAFAVGVLALLGKSIPANVRVLLLALAVIDDIAAVVVIALFYSSGLVQFSGLLVVALGVALVLVFQRMGIRSAPGLCRPRRPSCGSACCISGVHPTLAGVLLGLLTPVSHRPARQARSTPPPAHCDDLGSVHEGDAAWLREPLTRLEACAARLQCPPSYDCRWRYTRGWRSA